MTTADKIIFAYGVFAVLMLIAGLIYTIREFREIERHPENFIPKRHQGSQSMGKKTDL
jgi:hypothetical protein